MKNKKKVIKLENKKSKKKEIVNFISKVKNEAKKNDIAYDLRVTSYSVSNDKPYSYGIR